MRLDEKYCLSGKYPGLVISQLKEYSVSRSQQICLLVPQADVHVPGFGSMALTVELKKVRAHSLNICLTDDTDRYTLPIQCI